MKSNTSKTVVWYISWKVWKLCTCARTRFVTIRRTSFLSVSNYLTLRSFRLLATRCAPTWYPTRRLWLRLWGILQILTGRQLSIWSKLTQINGCEAASMSTIGSSMRIERTMKAKRQRSISMTSTKSTSIRSKRWNRRVELPRLNSISRSLIGRRCLTNFRRSLRNSIDIVLCKKTTKTWKIMSKLKAYFNRSWIWNRS